MRQTACQRQVDQAGDRLLARKNHTGLGSCASFLGHRWTCQDPHVMRMITYIKKASMNPSPFTSRASLLLFRDQLLEKGPEPPRMRLAMCQLGLDKLLQATKPSAPHVSTKTTKKAAGALCCTSVGSAPVAHSLESNAAAHTASITPKVQVALQGWRYTKTKQAKGVNHAQRSGNTCQGIRKIDIPHFLSNLLRCSW